MNESRIILDVDGVVADFIGRLIEYGKEHGFEGLPNSPEEVTDWWFFTYDDKVWHKAKDDPNFWLKMKPLNNANVRLGFTPHLWLTARATPSTITQLWLNNTQFPTSAVVTVDSTEEKIEFMKDFKDFVLVDDNIDTVQGVISNGGTAVLFKSHHQQKRQDHGLPVAETIEEVNLLHQSFIKREEIRNATKR